MTIIYQSPLTSRPAGIDFEVPSAKSVTFSRAGMTLTLKPGDPKVAGKPRCEAKPPAGEWIGLTLKLGAWVYAGPTILFQWHDHPPTGTSWEDWPSHEPLLALKFQSGRYWFVYGIEGAKQSSAKRAWPSGAVRVVCQFVADVHAGRATGRVGVKSEPFSGPSNYAGAGDPYPKFGIYAPSGGLTSPLSVTVRDLVVATTREEVG